MILSNATLAGLPFVLINRTTGAAVTSGTVSGYYLIDGGTQASLSGSFTHEGNGQWSISALTGAELNGRVIGLLFTHPDAVAAHYSIFADEEPKRGVAVTGFPFVMINSTTGETIDSGSVTGYRLLDGGTQTELAGTCLSKGNGQWCVDLTAAEMDGRTVGLVFVHSSGITQHFTIPTVGASGILGVSGAAGTPTIHSGLNPFWPMCFAKSRQNVLIGVNGIDRGIRWDGITTTAEPLGIDAPTVAPTIATPVGGDATAGDYICGYRYIDDEVPVPVASSLSPVTEVTAAEDDKFIWSGLQASAQPRVVGVELWRSTMGQATTVYKVTRLGHDGTITASANSSGTVIFTTTNPHGLIPGAVVTITGHSVGGYNGSHTVASVTDTTFTTATTYTSPGTEGTWQITGFTEDEFSDADFQALPADDQMLMILPNGGLNARRFVPPPNHKPFMAFFQDRLWMAGTVSYTQGMVSTTAGSATLSGSNTNWPETLEGRYLALPGEPELIEIVSVGSDNSITLARSTTATQAGVSYAIIPSPEERNQLYFSEIDEPESMSSLNVVQIQNNTGDDDEVTGLMPYGSALFVLKDRHLYRLTYFSQPLIDVSISLVARRGCVNNRCWTRLDDMAFLMDEQGIYAFTGGGVQPISEPIRDLFRDGVIDWSKSKWFHAEADPVQEVVRFHVNYKTDATHTRPIRWLEYNVRGGQWSTGSSVMEIGASCLTRIDNRLRVLGFAEGDVVYLMGEGLCDHVSHATAGSVTSATSTTLTDSTAAFAASVVGAPVAITAGTGKGQVRRITGRTTTELTVGAWDTTPDATSQYAIGAIQWDMKTGLFQFANVDAENRRDIRIIFEPTNGEATLDVRRYINHSTSPEVAAISLDRDDGVTMEAGQPDAVLDMNLTRSALDNSSGFGQHRIPGRLDADAQTDRFLAVELRGFQCGKEIRLYRMELLGVVGGAG